MVVKQTTQVRQLNWHQHRANAKPIIVPMLALQVPEMTLSRIVQLQHEEYENKRMALYYTPRGEREGFCQSMSRNSLGLPVANIHRSEYVIYLYIRYTITNMIPSPVAARIAVHETK